MEPNKINWKDYKGYSVSTRQDTGGQTTYLLRGNTGSGSKKLTNWMAKESLGGFLKQNNPNAFQDNTIAGLFGAADKRAADFNDPSQYGTNKLLGGTGADQAKQMLGGLGDKFTFASCFCFAYDSTVN